VTVLEREHCVIVLVLYPYGRSLDGDTHVPVEQARQEEQEVFVPGEWIPYEQHPRRVGQAWLQGNYFPGELSRGWLYTFENA
jgi:hypothetical protein